MDQLVQCPVCTLFLHNGMSLESHLDTHPKDQVIKALCSIANKNNSCPSSRTSTPVHSERSYRSRSRTPAADDTSRWHGTNRSPETEQFWARTPSGSSSRAQSRAPSRTPSRTLSRTPRSVSSANISRNCTPDIRMADNLAFESTTVSSQSHSAQSSHSHRSRHSQYSMHQHMPKADKMQQTYPMGPVGGYDPQYMYYPEQQEDREVKYSRSAEYNAMNVNMFNYNVPTVGTNVKGQPNMTPNISSRKREPVKIMPKTNNLVNMMKTNVSAVPYLPAPVKPMHVMVPSAPTFVQKNVQNSMIMTGGLPNTQVQIETKTVPPLVQNHFNQLTSSTFTPGTTVVTQNSQYFYQEMVQNIDPKSFIPSMPTVFAGENMTNVAQTSSMYQNVMLVDQFGNASCMYATPQAMIPKSCAPTMFSNNLMSNAHLDKPNANDPNKTLIIEVGPIGPSEPVTSCSTSTISTMPQHGNPVSVSNFAIPKLETPSTSKSDKSDIQSEMQTTTKGLKILSNIKVEVPVQHNKNMINTVMDLTISNDSEYQERSASPEKILPDLEDHKPSTSEDFAQSGSGAHTAHSFSELKKIASPTSNKDSFSKNSNVDKLDTEFGDSCPMPDLICNEKPSISPCSELSENGDNSRDRTSLSPKPEASASGTCKNIDSKENKINLPLKPFRSNPLRLNNIYVKKNKKVLQIKNAKPFTNTKFSKSDAPVPCTSRAPDNFMVKKNEDIAEVETSTLKTISIEEIKEKEELANFENVEMDSLEEKTEIGSGLPPVNESRQGMDIVRVKEEISTSNEGAFSNEATGPSHEEDLHALDPLRPISVSYGAVAVSMSPTEFDDEADNRELLDLEGAGKTKQFVTMMNDNYFGDNIYADYFTADRVEGFDDKGPTVFKDNSKEAFSCNIWGEPSSKENEFVLPNFIHESYKIAESGIEYGMSERAERAERSERVDRDADSKAEPALDICADERMPPRGDLSGQESNGDMDSAWNGMYSEVTPAEPYDLIARESWVSDGSELDVNEKRDNLEEELHFPKVRMYTCMQCGVKFSQLKELRTHKAAVHALPTCSNKTSYSKMVSARLIKKEEKTEDNNLSCTENLLTIDTKETITSQILQVYDTIVEDKPKLLRGIIKQETKRKRRDFICPTCKVDQLTDAAFTAHLKIHPLECLTCGKCFFRRANLALHLKTHLGIKNYKCDICEKRFITRQKLSEHHNVHTGRQPVKCTLCDDSFRRYSNMVQHRDRHHFHKRARTREFACACGLVFASRARFLWHKETHEERPKACPYCSDKFVHAASLTRHVRRTHNQYYMHVPTKTKADNVPCPICKQVYLRTNLRAHLLTHSGKRPYSCVICNKAFTTKWNLKLHRWTHMSRSAKPFKCSLCKGAFIRHTEYVSHMNAHKSVRPYTCNYCGCQFIRKYNCQRHVREHEMAKKFVCKVPECGKSFHRSYYLSEHMKVHSGARPFSCNICGKTSSNKSNHNKHVKIHHAREPIATEA